MKIKRSMSHLLLTGVIAFTAIQADAGPGRVHRGPRQRIALATYATTEEQARAIRALVRSVRERGGIDSSCPFYVVSPDPALFKNGRLGQWQVEVLPLEMERPFMDYPLAIKAFAAAQVEKMVKDSMDTLIWLDPGVLVLNPLDALHLGKGFDAVVRPVTLANTIGIPPQSEPNDYWRPIYAATGLDSRRLPTLTTIADEVKIQPYYNCEVFSFDPKLGIAAEWARLLTRFLKDDDYQKNVCTTFLRRLFLHQAVLSAVLTSRLKPERIKALPLINGYPFNQHQQLPEVKRVARFDEIGIVILDRTWQQDGHWLERIPASASLRKWLHHVYQDYLPEQ